MSKQNNNKKLVKIVTILWHWDQSHYLDELWSLLIKMFAVLDVIFFLIENTLSSIILYN